MTVLYCNQADLDAAVTRRRLVEATDDEDPTSSGRVIAERVDAAIAGASSVIDSYVGQRYPLPLPQIPDVLRRVAVNLAVRDLFARVQDGEMSQGVRDRAKEAIAMLEGIRDGKISLGLAVTAAAPDRVGAKFANPAPQLFGSRRLARMDCDIHGGLR